MGLISTGEVISMAGMGFLLLLSETGVLWESECLQG